MSETYKLYLCQECANGTLGIDAILASHEVYEKRCEFCNKKKLTGLYTVRIKSKGEKHG